MTKLFKNSKSVLSFVLAFAVLAVSLFTGVVINSDAASCVDDLSQLNVVYANGGISQTAPTKGTGSETDPFIIENPSHLRYIAQKSTPETTYGKYYKVDDSVDIMVFQKESYINAVAGSLEAFLALDAEGTKTALSNETDRIQFQSGTSGSDASTYDGFAGIIDFNGVTICGMYNKNGGLIAMTNGGVTLKNVILRNNLTESGWYNGNLVGFVHTGSASIDTYKPATFSNVVIHDCYQTTTGNGWGSTGVLMGSGINSKNIPIHVSNILTYDNISLGQKSSSDTTMMDCALYGMLPSSWNGEGVGVANASFSNIVTLDCVPYPIAELNNQCTRPAFWSNVYTTLLDAQNREPCTFNQDGDQWHLFDITKIDSADLALGAAAKTNMPDLDWTNVWVAVDGAYPELQALHDFKAIDNENGTHTTKCEECALAIGTAPHNFVGGVCACGYEAKCGDVVLYWDGSADATLADNGEVGIPDNPIIIDNAAELNYLANSVTGASDAGKKYYKMADGIDTIILQPASIATADADANGVYDILETADIKAYFETIGVSNLANWAAKDAETWFAGTFDGNGTQFVGMYAKARSVGLFPTVDGGATIKNLAVLNSYVHGSKNSNDGTRTDGQSRTGAIVGGTCGYKFGAKVAGTVTFDTVIVANNYIYTERGKVQGAVLLGSDNTEEAVAVNNAIVYGNNTACADAPDASLYLANGVGTSSTSTAATGVDAPSIANSIILGVEPYGSSIKAAEYFTNVYTDADTTNYAEANIKSVAGLVGTELKDACAALDWTNTFLATADMPTFRAFHDAEFSATFDEETHSLACSCGLAITAEPHNWVNGECDGCEATCAHEAQPEFVPVSEQDCVSGTIGNVVCSNCGFVLATDIPYGDEPLGHDMKIVEGTPAYCGVAGVKDYYDCVRCDYVSEDEAGEIAIENLDEWKVIPALDHTPATDDNGTVYAWDDTTPGMHYTVCDRCGENYDGTTCTGEYVFDDEGHEGECTVCGIATAGKEAHSNFDDNHKCGTCDWVCPHAEYVDGEATNLYGDKCQRIETSCAVCGTAGEARETDHDVEGQEWNDGESTATCLEAGKLSQYKICNVCSGYGATQEIDAEATGHDFYEYEAADPTCVWEGNIAYKYCYGCWNNFAIDAANDEPMENALADEDVYIAADPEAHVWVEYEAADADCDNDGYAEDHKYCSECFIFVIGDETTDIVLEFDKFYEEEYDDEGNSTPIGLGAIAGSEVMALEEQAWADFLAENYPDLEVPVRPGMDAEWEDWEAYYEAEAAFYEALGDYEEAYEEFYAPYAEMCEAIWAEAYHQYFLQAAAADEDNPVDLVVPATGHNLVKVDEVPATYEADGVKAHWACKDCDKLYVDAEGTEEVKAEDLVIAKLVKEEEKPADKPADKEDDKTTGDSGDKSPATGESVASVAAVAALMGAAFVLVRKARKA